MASVTQVLAAIRSHESSGFSNPYGLTPEQNIDFPRSHASGAYQFQPATWQSYTAESGIGTQYAQAFQAPPQIQDAVAGWVVINKGTGDWSPYSGALPPVTFVDVTPEQLAAGSGLGNTSQFASDPLGGALGGTGFGDIGGQPAANFGANPSLGDPTTLMPGLINPNTGAGFGSVFNPGVSQAPGGLGDPNAGIGSPSATDGGASGIPSSAINPLGGLLGSGGNTDTSSTWFNRLKQDIGDIVARIGIGLLALILIALAAWAFTAGGGIGAAREATARTIKKSAGFT